MGAFTNAGQIADFTEVLCGQSGVNRSKIPRRLIWDVTNLKSKEVAHRTGILDATATITTVADQELYEKPEGVLHIKEVHVGTELAIKITREDVIRLRNFVDNAETTDQGTSITWHFYLENRGTLGYIGIVDMNGNAPTTAGISIEIFYSSFPDSIESDNDEIGIPEIYAMDLAKGVAAEIMKMNGRMDALVQSHEAAFNRMLYAATHDAIDSASMPLIQFPLDLSME